MFHPKHVERLAGNNKILYKVSSRWNFLKLKFWGEYASFLQEVGQTVRKNDQKWRND
jgi:hypothetical protein